MPDLTKIATCSYCGTRSVLRLSGRVQHELACGSCGAKLHNMKPVRVERTEHHPQPNGMARTRPKRPARPRKAKKKSYRAKQFFGMIEDIWDEIEDILD